MTIVSRCAFLVFSIFFGRVVVDVNYVDRAKRFLRAGLIEQEQELRESIQGTAAALSMTSTPWLDRLNDRTYSALGHEAYQRAAAAAEDGIVRMKGYHLALQEVGATVGRALWGEEISDTRVKQILEINRVV